MITALLRLVARTNAEPDQMPCSILRHCRKRDVVPDDELNQEQRVQRADHDRTWWWVRRGYGPFGDRPRLK